MFLNNKRERPGHKRDDEHRHHGLKQSAIDRLSAVKANIEAGIEGRNAQKTEAT